MDLKQTGWEVRHWLDLGQCKKKLLGTVNMVISLQFL